MSSETSSATGLAGRYATALFGLANEANALEQVAEDLTSLKAMVDESEDLRRLVRSPVIAREDQSRAVLALMEKAGASDLSKKFIGLVAKNRRLFELAGMITSYLALLAAHRGEVKAEVTSAKKLTQKQLESVISALKTGVGSDVTVDEKVDPSLLGGLVVKVGSRMVDSSLRTKLQHLQLAMKGVG